MNNSILSFVVVMALFISAGNVLAGPLEDIESALSQIASSQDQLSQIQYNQWKAGVADASLAVSSLSIIGNKNVYSIREAIKFSVKPNNDLAVYNKGFRVVARIMNGFLPIRSINGTYNAASGWSVSGYVPKTDRPYIMQVAIYCSNPKAGCPKDNIIYKSFVFTAVKPSVTVTSPNAKENWQIGSTQNITWESIAVDSASITRVRYDSTTPSKVVSQNSINANVTSSGTYSWKVGDITSGPKIVASDKYKIKISSRGLGMASDLSDDFFTISDASTSN